MVLRGCDVVWFVLIQLYFGLMQFTSGSPWLMPSPKPCPGWSARVLASTGWGACEQLNGLDGRDTVFEACALALF